MTLRRALLPLLALACGLSACKDGDKPLDSGLPEDKQASELTPTEQNQLCEARETYAAAQLSESEAARYACTSAGVLFTLSFGSGTQAECETVRDQCLAEPGDPVEEPATCELGVDWASCMASVGELERCYEEYTDDSVEALRSLSCAKIEEYKANPPDGEASLGPACSAAQAKCATVLGGAAP